MATETVTGQQEFARIIQGYIDSGKSSARMKKLRSGEFKWTYPQLAHRSQIDASTIRKWVRDGNKPNHDNFITFMYLFFADDVISGDVKDNEYEYLKTAINHWNSQIPYDALAQSIREDVHPLAGRYVMLRPTFDKEDYFGLYDVSFVYNYRLGRLEFRDTALKGQESTSFITQPEKSPHIEIVDIRPDGFNSLAICAVPDEDGYIHGAIFTMGPFSTNAHLPSIAPVVFFPFGDTAKVGLVSPNDQQYSVYAKLIARSRDPIYFKLHNMISF